MSDDPYQKFRALLNEHHRFPSQYTHKFIGKNSPHFLESVAEFEGKFIGLSKETERQSASGKHIALTYLYWAASADDVIKLTTETHKINDIIYIL